MEGRRQDSLGFNGDISSKIPSSSSSTFTLPRKDHQILYNNNNNDSTLIFPDPTSTAATRSIRSPQTASPNPVKYRECLKNYAANMGGLVLDGCGEFMPMGAEGTPGALKCAACKCHRNFHRKEIEGDSTVFGPETRANPNPSPLPLRPNSLVQRHFRGASSSAPVMMSFRGPAESSSEDLNVFLQGEGSRGKKRFRTKFSSEQKEMMMEFAEKLGWKIQKQDEQQLQQFCSSIGIKRKVFKVWMHNNKQAMKKKQI